MTGHPERGLEPLAAAAERHVARSPADATLVSWVERDRRSAHQSARGRRAESAAEREVAIRVRVSGRTGAARTALAGPGDLEACLRTALADARAADPSPDWDVSSAAAPLGAHAPAPDPDLLGLAAEAAQAELERLAGPRTTLRLDWHDERIVVAGSFLPTRTLYAAAITCAVRSGRRPGSGFAAASAASRAGLALAGLVARAAALEASGIVEEVPAAALPLVLAPEATAVLVEAFARVALGSRRALAGRRAPDIAAAVDLADEPLAAHGLPRPFDLDGCRCADRPFVTAGRPVAAAFDLDLAARAGAAPTGHGLAADDAWPLHPALAAGTADEAALRERAAGGLRVGSIERLAVADDEALSIFAVARNLRRIGPGGELGAGLPPLAWRTSLAVLLGAVAERGCERITWALRPGLPGAPTVPALRLAPVGGFAPLPAAARA